MKKIITTLPDPPWNDNVTHNLQIKYIMTPKEEAKQLIDKYIQLLQYQNPYWGMEEEAKQCALISVEEIIEVLEDLADYNWAVEDECNFYKDVKKEIEKL